MNDAFEPELTLRDYAHVVARRKWVVVIAVLTSLIAAVAMSTAQTPIYQASAEMLVKTRSSDTVFGNGTVTVGDPKRALSTEIKVLESQVVSLRVQKNLSLVEAPPAVSGTSDGLTDVVEVSVRSGDSETARVLANAYVQA
jgi:uncharacterized protein involved in exopolysaccharide biosynthesis